MEIKKKKENSPPTVKNPTKILLVFTYILFSDCLKILILFWGKGKCTEQIMKTKAKENFIESDSLSLSVYIYRDLRKDVLFCVNTIQQGF